MDQRRRVRHQPMEERKVKIMLGIIFTNFWTWIGTVILVGVVCAGVADIIEAARKPSRAVDIYELPTGDRTVRIENATPEDIERAIQAAGWKDGKRA